MLAIIQKGLIMYNAFKSSNPRRPVKWWAIKFSNLGSERSSSDVMLVEAEKWRHTHQVDLSKHLEGVLESQALDPILGVAVMMFLVTWVLVTQLRWVQSSLSKGSFVKLVY